MTAPAQPTAGCPMSPLPDGMKTPCVRSGPISKTIRVLSARHVAKPTTRCRARKRRSRSGRSRRCAFSCLACASPAPPLFHLVRAQVRRTHGYYESNYALQNDCGLSFGESTASAVFRADMLGTKGTDGAALLCVNELTKLAAERTCRSREAVSLMGRLAETYGFYGPDGGAGEVLTVGDKEEAWVTLADRTATHPCRRRASPRPQAPGPRP